MHMLQLQYSFNTFGLTAQMQLERPVKDIMIHFHVIMYKGIQYNTIIKYLLQFHL